MWTELPAELPAARVGARAPDHGEIHDPLRGGERPRGLPAPERDVLAELPGPGPGQDAVADFLFRDHTGFCEQFASADAVMLRTLDVPARVVSGLAYGTPRRQRAAFTAADAHAWVEVYYPGIGWSPTDPTAGVTPGHDRRGPALAVAAARPHAISADLPGGRIG